MISKFVRRALFGKAKMKNAAKVEIQPDRNQAAKVDTAAAATKSRVIPQWETALTASLKENCLAPADEVILHAFDLYCDGLHAPFRARQHRMAAQYSKIAAGFAQVQAMAPDMVERAAAKHRLELDRFIDKKGDV